MQSIIRIIICYAGLAMVFILISCGSGNLPMPTVTTVAGTGEIGSSDGDGSEATFNNPDGVALAPQNEGDIGDSLYITDMGNNEVRFIDADGEVNTVAGTGAAGYVDGPAQAAQFNNPDGIVSDAEGNIYVADSGNNVIRMISPTGVVSTVAGTGESGNTDGDVSEAEFDTPTGITIDDARNLYVSDEGNNVVRKIASDGNVSTIAGNGVPGFGDGAVGEAQFNAPHGIAIDTTGNLYVTDAGNNRIRKIDVTSGEVSTIAGNGTAGDQDGAVSNSQINKPHGISVDLDGAVYFADEDNNKVKKIDGGEIKTFAGADDSESGFEDGPSDRAKFNCPRGLALGWDKKSVYICDYCNQRVRKISQ